MPIIQGINHTKFLSWCLINRQNMSIILLLMNLVHFPPYYAAILQPLAWALGLRTHSYPHFEVPASFHLGPAEVSSAVHSQDIPRSDLLLH